MIPGEHITNSQIKSKTSMIKSSLCNYSNAYQLRSGTITITGVGDDAAARKANKRNKEVVFENYAPFTDC